MSIDQRDGVYKTMEVIVTGATSFLGTAIINHLLVHGNKVYAVVRPGTRNFQNLMDRIPPNKINELKILPVEMSNIAMILNMVTEGCDAWIHTSWDGAGSSNRTNREIQQKNVKASEMALRAAADLGCKRFIFTGSQAEYGIHHEPLSEDTFINPVSEYGKAKADFCHIAQKMCNNLKLEYVHTRIFSVYGPGDHGGSLIQTCLSGWNRGEQVLLSECTQKWNYLYIDDAASALVHLLTEGAAGIYNVAGDEIRVLRDFVEEMYQLSGKKGSFLFGKRKFNAEGAADLIPNISKILRETSWKPKISFEEGIYETMRCMWGQSARMESI